MRYIQSVTYLVYGYKQIILSIHPRILNVNPISILLESNGPHSISIYFTYIGVFHFDKPFII